MAKLIDKIKPAQIISNYDGDIVMVGIYTVSAQKRGARPPEWYVTDITGAPDEEALFVLRDGSIYSQYYITDGYRIWSGSGDYGGKIRATILSNKVSIKNRCPYNYRRKSRNYNKA